MTRPTPERFNNRVIQLAAGTVKLPFRLAAAAYRRVSALLQGLRSPEALRAKDQLRQSRARRKLRGLAGDHVQKTYEPS